MPHLITLPVNLVEARGTCDEQVLGGCRASEEEEAEK